MHLSDGLSLISWNGSMFEYLMPPLLLRSGLGTLVDQSERVASQSPRPGAGSDGGGAGSVPIAVALRPTGIVGPFCLRRQQQGLKLDRVMVCWGTAAGAATRAVADSIPFLQKAKQVDVVMVASNPAKSDEIPGADLGQHLARYGLKVDVKRKGVTIAGGVCAVVRSIDHVVKLGL
jgi:hypothetical protein